MSREENDEWLSSRVRDIAPEPNIEVPIADDGSVIFDAMDSDDINQYMAARAGGAEFEHA